MWTCAYASRAGESVGFITFTKETVVKREQHPPEFAVQQLPCHPEKIGCQGPVSFKGLALWRAFEASGGGALLGEPLLMAWHTVGDK